MWRRHAATWTPMSCCRCRSPETPWAKCPQLEARRAQLRATLPIRRVVGPADIAALAVHLMTNTAITGATFDIDGGQQLVEG